ncbi:MULTISPECIES: TonB-dependent receptor [unclassified Spirosoma]|uniref:TonB-dependent receptor domain-containing protein n=1 Tax=unclassified Spirosoma TaxID=2621999 RepID=UPI0009617CC6|nr:MULTISPECIES: TonB-dependent receptor [unclassified Spirosoma]MBN8822587.1 TonB-dependent receptor [Spirosoma sp.]OJW74081.1 MAG: TonB-dependent receptor [Spirosoma sp. 48-14]
MKSFLLTLLALASSTGILLAQQTKISGSLLDSAANKPVEFATVALLKEGKIVDGATADASGKFVFTKASAGKYGLQFTFVGYTPKIVEGINVVAGQDLDVGVIKLSQAVQKLAEVTVTEQKSLFEEKSDRMVYNAEKDISVKGGDATDVLKKIPSIAVDIEGNVQLRGSSNIKVLINNKPSSIVARSISDALKQIPADIIKQVEVITSPSAKYDAEGTAGIINIITKKNSLQGTNGSISPNFSQWNNWQNASINHRMKNLSLSANGGYSDWKNKRYIELLRSFSAEGVTTNQRQPQWVIGNGQNVYANFNADWDIDSLNRMGAGINYYNGDNTNGFNIDFEESRQGVISQYFHRDMSRTYDWAGATLNLDYTRLFKKPKKELNFLMMYSFEGEDSDYWSNLLNRENTVYYREKSYNINNNKEGTIQLDFTNPLDSISKLELGTKTIFRQILSDYRIANAVDGSTNFSDQPSLANVFDYAQQVVAGYVVYSRTPKKNWGINLGARYEHTFIQANFLNGTAPFSSTYGNFIPSVSLSRSLKKEQQIRFNYSQRIQRPQFYYLNPYVNQSDSKNLYGGNPYLKPELTHSVEANYSISIKQTSLNLSAFLRQTNNAIESINTVDDQGVLKQIFQNVAQNSAYGFNLSANTKLTKQWSVNGSLNVFYNVLESAELKTRNADWMYRINLNSSVDFGKGIKAQFFGFYNSARVNLQGSYGGFGFYNIVVQKEVLKKKGTIGFGYDNPFNETISWRNDFVGPNFVQTQDISMYRRGWRLNLKYEFGKMSSSQRQKKRISNDDKKGGDGNN